MSFTIEEIQQNFDSRTYARAVAYVRDNCVLEITRYGDVLEAQVRGSANQVYTQSIEWFAARKGVDFEGDCSCPVGYNCKHVAAVLLTYVMKRRSTAALATTPAGVQPAALSHAMTSWMQRMGQAAGQAAGQTTGSAAQARPAAASAKPKTVYRLLYVLVPDHAGRRVTLYLCKARLRVNGEVASASQVNELYYLLATMPSYVQPEDEDLVRLVVAMCTGQGSYGDSYTEPKGKIGAQLLQMLTQRQQLLWANSLVDLRKGLLYPLQHTPLRHAELGWREQENYLRLGWQFQLEADAGQDQPDKSIDYLLPTDPPWYIDNLSCGELCLQQGSSGLSLGQLQELVAQAPPLPLKDKVALSHLLLAQGLNRIVPLPQQLQESVRHDIRPTPCLQLNSMPLLRTTGQAAPPGGNMAETQWLDYVRLDFEYDGYPVSSACTTPIVRPVPQGIERIERDGAAEAQASRTLQALGFVSPQPDSALFQTQPGALLLPSQADWLRFTAHELAQLQEQGWRIDKLPQYRYELAEVDDWYAEVDDHSGEAGSPWFDLELGIVVNQVRVSLLPVLVDLIRNAPHDFNPAALAAHADSDQLLATLPDGVRVALPWSRIKPILGTLGELYFSDRVGSSIKLSTLDAARLAELGAATDLRWMGGERLRQIGQKLSQFVSQSGGISAVAKPHGLQATLRDYQKDGLDWMQFLREYDLAGILADDMGLGKTVQTLAHILAEKEAGRLERPALVVAPTSLMGNWQDEAARFAPALRVLVLQGKERQQYFDQIAQYDLVLTTYALLPRDEEVLRQQRFHLLILDESHYIKNARSKAAQTAGLLQARHRLCLTGTPLENHLGELWSQFHFLLPGLLGSEKSFNAEFRHPIEKQGNDSRRALLARRIRPFLLRRTKDKVATELPPKTEMVRNVELSGAQRDLYETVRLAMDKKVRSEIAKKGVARSQIVILEALLKLRQVCCDPRLVKSGKVAGTTAGTARKSAPPSAKLIELMEMIDELLQENRKILVFSQFTSMLALIEAELEARKVDYALLTGDTIDRAAAVRAFQNGQVPIFLISLKAGGVGLNLTAADTVIHYDPWWNPAAENQATDRAWRIGQDKPVFVYKLIAKGTLEEKIQQLQQTKSALAQSMLADGEARNMKITQDDLHMIFAPLAP